MGIGRLDGSKFDLVLSVRHDASRTELDEWERSFQHASELLYDATDGQHQLGDVYVCNDSTGSASADVWLMEAERGRANAGGLAVLGNRGTHVTLHGEDRFRPFIVVHELVHHLYGPADEYSGPSGDAECVDDEDATACIMEAAWSEGDRFGADGDGGSFVEGQYSELCVAGNHDPDDDTYQDDIYDEPCWETMADEFGGLSVPGGTPDDPPPDDADEIDWIELASEERFVLAVDRSGSMSGSKLEEAKYGADWWAEQALDGEHLGVVSYATRASSPPDYPLQEVSGDPDRTSAQGAISGITSGGRTAVGDALRTALDELRDAGDRAATQVVVLLTDGRHNEGEDPASVLPDLVDYGVRVYTVGIGDTIDSSLLREIASETGGEFHRIDPSLPQSDQEFEIRTTLQEISGEARDGGGLVTTIPERVGGEAAGYGEPTERRRVEIEEGSDLATFALSWRDPDSVLRLTAESPGGTVYEPGRVPAGGRELDAREPWHGYHVHDPEPGHWQLRVHVEEGEESVEAETMVFSRNRSIGAGLFGRDRVARNGQIRTQLQVYHDDPIEDFDVDAYVQRPGGEREPVEFSFEGDQTGCDAGIATASYERTHAPGFYTVSATVRAREARTVEGGEKPVEQDEVEPEPIPAFQRTFTRTVQVGEEPGVDVRVDPPTGAVGDRLRLTVSGTNTHFYQGGTRLSLGPGVTVEEIEVEDRENLTASIRIHEEASIGDRSVVVSTPRYDEHVAIEAGFEVTDDERAVTTPISPIRSLRYDALGRLHGVDLDDGNGFVEVPRESDEFLTAAKERGDDVSVRVDEDSGEVEGFDVF